MPITEHEAVTLLFRNRPQLAADLLGVVGNSARSSFARRYFADGKADGEVDALLAFLDARGIMLTDEQCARIEECHDLPQLQKWVRMAAVAESADELFD